VTSRPDLAGLVLLQVPMILCLGITAWRLVRVHFMPAWISYIVYACSPLSWCNRSARFCELIPR